MENMKKIIIIGTSVIVMITGIILLLMSFTSVREGQVRVLTRFGEAQRVLEPGLHFRNPFTTSTTIIPVQMQGMDIDFNAHSIDAQPVRGGITVHFQIIASEAMDVVSNFVNTTNLRSGLFPIFLGEAQNVMATKSAMELVENRALLAGEIQERLSAISFDYHIVINNVILEDLYFSEEFNRAVETRMRAEQEMLMAELERERALIQASQQLEIAQKQGEALVITANADAEALQVMQNAWGELGGEVREAMLRQMFFESWNGILPQVVGGDNLGLIMDGLN